MCRWAGDEFVILLPDTTAEQAERALERTRRKVAAYDWAALGLDVPVTISVGIASAARGDDRRTLFAAADGVLYDAKRSGRDRVVRLSGVTQTRAPAQPARRAVRPAAVRRDASHVATPRSRDAADVQPSPLDAPTRRGRRVRPAPGRPGPVDPPLGLRRRRPAAGPGADRVRAAAARRPPPPARARRHLGAPAARTEQVLALVREARARAPRPPRAGAPRDRPRRSSPWPREHDAYTTMDAAAMAAAVGPLPEPVGRVRVLCAGGGDVPVAAEAAFVARVTGTEVVRVDDVGGSRLRATARPTARCSSDVDCLVVVAGLDASLATTIGAMTDVPVVAVPTSTGQPGAFGGLGALMTMLTARPRRASPSATSTTATPPASSPPASPAAPR